MRSTSAVLSSEFSRPIGPVRFHCGSECRAGNANQYVNLYFFRSAYDRIRKDASSDGHEYIVPSLIASQIYYPPISKLSLKRQSTGMTQVKLLKTNLLARLLDHRTLVRVLELLDRVDVLNVAFGSSHAQRPAFVPIIRLWFVKYKSKRAWELTGRLSGRSPRSAFSCWPLDSLATEVHISPRRGGPKSRACHGRVWMKRGPNRRAARSPRRMSQT